jgi:AraC-like DNA-binding protein
MVDVAVRYQLLASVVARYSVDAQDDLFAIVIDGAAIPADVRDYFVEREAALVFVAGAALGLRIPALRMEWQMSAARGAALSRVDPFDSLPMAVEQPHTRLLVPRAFLDEPMSHADSYTAALIERQCRDALRELLNSNSGLAAIVRERLLRDPGVVPTMPQVAGELHITVRTLRRQLAAEAVTFRGLLNSVRDAAAAELLRTGASIEDVARRLGYAETANFTHAFTRWRGMSPRAYRQSLLSKP